MEDLIAAAEIMRTAFAGYTDTQAKVEAVAIIDKALARLQGGEAALGGE